MLGTIGETLFRRGFPRTHPWARARVVFEVARQWCLERYPSTKAVTLWSLPASIEDAFDHRWASWAEAMESIRALRNRSVHILIEANLVQE